MDATIHALTTRVRVMTAGAYPCAAACLLVVAHDRDPRPDYSRTTAQPRAWRRGCGAASARGIIRL